MNEQVWKSGDPEPVAARYICYMSDGTFRALVWNTGYGCGRWRWWTQCGDPVLSDRVARYTVFPEVDDEEMRSREKAVRECGGRRGPMRFREEKPPSSGLGVRL